MAPASIGKGLVILDRDGVINQDSDEFVKSADEWLPIPGSINAVAALSGAGYTIAVATNQSGLARGLFDEDALDAMHDKLRELVATAGGRVDYIVVCPHGPDDNCDCRKPKPGMYLQIAEHFGISLQGVPVIGDTLRDLEAATAAGAQAMLVRTGNGTTTEGLLTGELASAPVFDDLAAAALHILADH